MSDLLGQFISESRDLLEKAAEGLLALEKAPDDGDLVNTVFRSVHTLKGASGLFEIAPLTRLVHAGEDLLGAVRAGTLMLDPGTVDLLLDGLDQVSRWLDDLEAAGCLPDGAGALSDGMVARQRALLVTEMTVADAAVAAGDVSQGAVPWLAEFSEAERLTAMERALEGAAVWAVDYRPDSQCFFNGEDPAYLARQLPDVLALRIAPTMALPALVDYDPFVCAVRFQLLTAAPGETVRDLFRYVEEQVEIVAVQPQHLILLAGDRIDGPLYEDFAGNARSWLERGDAARLRAAGRTLLELTGSGTHQASGLRALLAALGPDDCRRPLPGWLNALVDAIAGGTDPDWTIAPRSAGIDHGIRLDDDSRAILQAQLRLLDCPCAPEVRLGHLEAATAAVRNTLRAGRQDDGALEAALAKAAEEAAGEDDTATLRTLLITLLADRPAAAPAVRPERTAEPAREGNQPAERPPEETRSETAAAQKVLKVDQGKVDSLMNLIGELVVAKNGLPYLSRRAEQIYASREMAREIKDQHAVIDRIAQELQEAIMAVRMLPVGQMFQRFPRLVRDLARRLDKRIELVVTGEETEADKAVVETLVDPLVHMIRNAIDHGIEPPEDRIAAGKPETGTICLSACQENDRVVIEVADDGAGIDPEMIRRKAVQRGLLTAEAADALSDGDAVNLVFAPGFSTKEQVSDLSGRGVGMDVVRTAVEKAGGTATLTSTLGGGATVRLAVPLTMAVTRVMSVDVAGHAFGIPMDVIAETVRIPQERIHSIRGDEAFVLRNTVVPLVRLTRLLDLPSAAAPPEEEAVMVVRFGKERLGVVVDGFRESLEVIVKPMDGILAGMPGYSGTALLGDGRVLLVLDLKELV
ncbi:chemotaxis protein CheW [Azospirillum endophyticum]